jgi:hypothetical protein
MPLILRSGVSAKQVAKALRSLGIRFSEEARRSLRFMNIRIGHPARILEDLESYSIYAQLEKEVERLGLANFW